jgi:hypothetical protein
MQEYEGLTNNESCHPDVWINLACCYFMLGMYDEAKAAIDKGSDIMYVYCYTSYSLQVLKLASFTTDCHFIWQRK